MRKVILAIVFAAIGTASAVADVGGFASSVRNGSAASNPAVCKPYGDNVYINWSTTPATFNFCSASNTWTGIVSTSGATFTGPVLLANGTAAAPSLGFSSDSDGSGTGLFRSAANAIGVTTNGTERWTFNASGGLNCATDGGCVVGNGSADPDTVSVKTGVDYRGATSGVTRLKASAVAGATTVTLPAATDQLVGRATTDTLTNKTLTSPAITTPTGLVKGDVGLGNVDNTSDATKNAASATLTNKTVDLGSNTVTGTTAQFNAALSDNDFATLAGTETLTNKSFSILKPPSDSTSALRVTNAGLTSNLAIFDTTNLRLGIGGTPTSTLDVQSTSTLVARTASTGAAGTAISRVEAGDGTTSSSQAYIQFLLTKTATKDWRIGFQGSDDFKLRGPDGATDTMVAEAATNYVQFSKFIQVQGGRKRVSTQFDKTNTTLADITGLSVTVLAARTYTFTATLYVTAAAAGGAKVAVAGTATATAIRYGATTYTAATVNAQAQATALGTAVGASTTAVDKIVMDGTITVNAGGTLTLQFAQNASSGTSSVLVGSFWWVEDTQ